MPESEAPKLYPNLDLSGSSHKALKNGSKKDVIDGLKTELTANNAYKMWERMAKEGVKLGSVPKDLEEKAGAEIKELDEKLAAAKESGGETEVQEISFQKANVLAKHGDFEASNAIYGEIKKEKKVSSGKKIEAGFGEARNMLFANEGIGKLMEEVAEFCKLGGDWDKRNRHAIYLALHNLRDREIEKAADAMRAGVKTFNAEEVISFKEFCKLCTIASIVTASRSSLKKDIIDCPEVKAQLGNDEEGEIVLGVARDLYETNYDSYMRGIVKLTNVMEMDIYLKTHSNYVVRELVVRGYEQFLRSYQSVTLDNMSEAFGVSKEHIDSTLSRFISANRLDVKIDKVNGVVERTERGTRGKGYEGIVKEGDKVLNKMARLSRLVDV